MNKILPAVAFFEKSGNRKSASYRLLIILRILLLFFGMIIFACHGNKKSADHIIGDTSRGIIKPGAGVILKRHYSSYNDFINYIRCNAINVTPVTLNDSLLKSSGEDTTIHYFEFSGIKFKYASVFLKEDTEENEAGDSLYTCYFAVNDQVVKAKTVPDSLRGNDFSSSRLSGLNLELNKAGKFELNGATYLFIPSVTAMCQGGFCETELDHIFEIRNNKVTYLTVDGWQICDVNNDNKIEQIVFNDNPMAQVHYLNNLKKKIGNEKLDLADVKCANIQIWTFKDKKWTPLLDKNNNPYYILLGFDHITDLASYKVLDYNWIKEL